MTVTGGQVGQSLVTIRTLFTIVGSLGTVGGQVGQSFVTVEVELAPPVVDVTGGQLRQSFVTVEVGPLPGVVITTGAQVEQGLVVTTTSETTTFGALGAIRGQVWQIFERVTVGFEPVIETGTTVIGEQVGQSLVVVTDGTVATVTGGHVGQSFVVVASGVSDCVDSGKTELA